MRKIIYLSFIMVLVFACNNAFAQTIVMKALDGTTKLNGGSTVPGHTSEIDISSFQFGMGSCKTCSTPSVSEVTVTLSLSPATISLKNLLLNGHRLTSVDFTFTRAGVDYYKVHMENVAVTGISESSGGDSPNFSLSLDGDKIAWQQNKTAGTTLRTSYGWDVVNNVPFLFY